MTKAMTAGELREMCAQEDVRPWDEFREPEMLAIWLFSAGPGHSGGSVGIPLGAGRDDARTMLRGLSRSYFGETH